MTAGLLSFATALAVCFGITIPVRQFALRVGMIDLPGPRKIHTQPVPLLGGIALYAAVISALLIAYPHEALDEILPIFWGVTLLVVVGTLDDRGLLHHQLKLFAGMPLAALILLIYGIRAQVFSTFFPGRFASIADGALTVFWITGITAAFSILDYMDGACAGTAAIASIFVTILAFSNGQTLMGTVAAAVSGASVGFLRWNFAPAKIFMGDSGAMFLGFLLGTLSLQLRVAARSPMANWLVPIFILAVPILDTTLISLSRLRRGLVPFTSPGKDHIGHRLSNLGLPTRAAVLIMYAAGSIFGLLAILCQKLSTSQLDWLSVLLLFALAGVIAVLECIPYERQDLPSQPFA